MAEFDRRIFLSFIPVVALVLPSTVRAFVKLNGPRKLFGDIASQFIHPDTNQLHTAGYHSYGDRGHASYVSDHLATPELAALAPRFCAISADGRRWRAALDPAGLVPVAAGGSVGSISLKLNPLVNDQPAIAQALAYQHAIKAAGLTFNDGNFSIWCPRRTAVNDNVNQDKSGIPFLIKGPTIFQSGPNLTTFNRRKFDGSDPAIFSGTQYLPSNFMNNGLGIYWRGGMFFLVGQPDPRPQYSVLSALHLRGNWQINGGIKWSSNSNGGGLAGDPAWYVLGSDGSGWDVTDKPIWAEDNRHTGDIIFEGNITVGAFRGELLYQGGICHGSIYQTGQLTVHDTDGDGFNPEPHFSNTPIGYGTLQMESLCIINAYQALEGGTGWNSYITNLAISDCTRGGGLIAGNWGPDPQPANRPVPILNVTNMAATRSAYYSIFGGIDVKSLNLVDTSLWVGQNDWSTYDSNIDNLNITADRAYLEDGVVMWGSGAAGSRGSYNNHIGLVTLKQTLAAQALGYCVIDPVTCYGSLGNGNVIDYLQGVSWMPPENRNPVSVFDDSVDISGVNLQYLQHCCVAF